MEPINNGNSYVSTSGLSVSKVLQLNIIKRRMRFPKYMYLISAQDAKESDE